MTKSEICLFGFSALLKDCGTNTVDLATELKKCSVNALELLCLFLFMYVFVAILNLPHPYLRRTFVLLDIKVTIAPMTR